MELLAAQICTDHDVVRPPYVDGPHPAGRTLRIGYLTHRPGIVPPPGAGP
jgi:hypothetical protein